MKFTLVDPVRKDQPKETELSPGIQDWEGKVVGFLCNRKDNARLLMEQMGEQMKQEWNIADYKVFEKYNAATGASPEILQKVASESDVVITGSGDWGACTSWSVHDAVELEKMGIPSAIVCTEPFMALADGEFRSLGIRPERMVEITHPLGAIPDEQVSAKSRTAVERAQQVLRAQAMAAEA